MNVTSISTSKQVYPVNRSKPNAAANDMSEMSFHSEISEKSVSELQNESLYQCLKDKAVSSTEELAQQWEHISGMYVPASTARKYYDPSLVGLPNDTVSFWECGSTKAGDLETEAWNNAIRSGCMLVQLGAGELPKFMDYVTDSLKNGISFEQALQNHFDDLPRLYGGLLQGNHDWFLVNPSNGDVMGAFKGGRVYTGSVASDEVIDRKAVYELADDLNTFLRYTVFSQSDDDPERVSDLISYIKNKQAYANFDRFLADGEKGITDTILQNLIDAGVLKDDDDEEQEEAVDRLMEALRNHQEELRENKLDIEGSKKTIAEIQEIYDSLS